ncbi:MAG: hypothetical protein CM15mP36_08900 [Flavobacteriales bacterium]|nr:MAG: hypothetical protein CM15mP36_08900 [Flavobacteriales bacterium]
MINKLTTKLSGMALLCVSLSLFSQEKKEIKLENYFGDLSARQIGPAVMSGRISDMENHPTDPMIIYAGSAGGGVWKSNDAGTTFYPIFDDHAQSIGAVELDPNDPNNTIYVGTGEPWPRNSVSVGDGLYKSTDGGNNWKKIGLENSERIANIIVNPKNSNEIFVAVLGALWSDSNERGVYKSSDGGVTWENILYLNESTGCADLAMDPSNPNILYASMWEFRRTGWSFNSGGDNSALYKSTDGGKNWKKIHNGFPEGKLGRLAIGVAKSNPNTLYTVIESEKNEDKGLYKSVDGGENWKQMNNDFGITVRPFYFSRIVVDPKDENVIVKAGLYGSISKDGGETFENLGSMHPDIHDMVFDINNSDIIYVGTDGGVYRTWNKGVTMEIVENLPLSQFYHISVDNEEPYNIYGGLQDNGSWYGPSFSSGGISAKDWKPVGQGDGFRVLRHPTKNIIYSEMQGAENVWRYDVDNNLVKTIQPLAVKGYEEYRFNWNAPIETSKNNADRLYIGSQYVHRSDDMGDTWEIISPDLTTNDSTKQNQEDSGGLSMDNSGAENHTTIFTITESPLNENIIWAGTDDGNIQVTKNGGKSWKNVVENVLGVPKNTWVYHIEASVHDENTAYVVFDGHTSGDMKAYAFKTTDLGKTWTNIIPNDDVTGFTRNIQEDYVNKDLLFLGTELGLYITINGGDKWSKFTKNVPPVAIHYIELQANTNDLVMGTHGRGVIIIDDISPLREINETNLSKKLYFFERDEFEIQEFGGFADNFGRETQFIGANSSLSCQIQYLLPRRHTFGKMTMEIQDMEGNKVTTLNPGKTKGINTVEWNYNMRTPKIAKGKTLSFGGFTSPTVPAGKYKVVIKKGRDTFEKTIDVTYKNNAGLNEDDRKFQHETVMKLFNMTEELAYMVYVIDELILNENTDESTISELNELKKSLVITTGDNYVGAAKKQLREKMSDLYSKVASSYDKPSANELENLVLIENEMKSANKRYSKILKKVNSTLIPKKSFEDFINE